MYSPNITPVSIRKWEWHFYKSRQNVCVNWKFYLKFHLKAKVLATLWELWKKTSQFPIFLWNKLNFYTILSKAGWSRAHLFQGHEIVPIFVLKQRKLSDHILVQAELFGNFALNSTTALKDHQKSTRSVCWREKYPNRLLNVSFLEGFKPFFYLEGIRSSLYFLRVNEIYNFVINPSKALFVCFSIFFMESIPLISHWL